MILYRVRSKTSFKWKQQNSPPALNTAHIKKELVTFSSNELQETLDVDM
ncbi:hypothetical protein [Halobacillus amylolyticus]|uniref:Uncharacterized protein n=1 Tax=Halobacillus amylolyticus TaxID=2932259 RepID=A0ABY4HG31_9BACI|nr:hypothetical protein [Halobacillus amylolyticus]UOR13607.1 hypothetical protein MUO15_09230 [Halobacillus amylolyticus]